MLSVDLSDHVVLVTGSAKGVGRDLLLATADAGASVAVHYNTSEAEATATMEEALERGASDATTVSGDVTDPDDVDALFDAVEADLGPVTALVNNVGAFAPQHWEDIDFETWQTVVETNFYGTYLCSKRALGPMRDAGFGRIVNVGYAGSEKALVYPVNFPYFVAKTGVLMFTRMLAADTTDDGITVNAVSPYVVENSDKFPDEAPRGRWASTDDIAQAMLFFLHPASDYVSGENIEVDGGWLPERL
ncbi:3-oxoacyl-ACP reductase [Haloferax elongans ATCC BAA-1513]|uniref:3-oxoacyl-ACP reductase n=1 Tax=Haloferax elongans ATCC BAA-1513 TaxID=1230453 RepID=M0HWN8_HALEO|nr:SDR family NAD(P)-dependent oxidoreductase [Haloferax elongans]ELZ87524.1 3-oxoacyl-ACP reductase [Haloferax elongans ATCC BAA-1513]